MVTLLFDLPNEMLLNIIEKAHDDNVLDPSQPAPIISTLRLVSRRISNLSRRFQVELLVLTPGGPFARANIANRITSRLDPGLELDIQIEDGIRRTCEYLRFFSKSPDLVPHCRYLQLELDVCPRGEIIECADNIEEDLEIWTKMGFLPGTALCPPGDVGSMDRRHNRLIYKKFAPALLLHTLSNILRLTLLCWYENSDLFFGESPANFFYDKSRPVYLPALERICWIFAKDGNGGEANISLSAISVTPQLKYLQIQYATSRLPFNAASFSGPTLITVIVLFRCNIDAGWLTELFKLTPNLRVFNYNQRLLRNGKLRRDGFHPSTIWEALLFVQDTLEVLEFTCDAPLEEIASRETIGPLTDFVKLRGLTIDPTLVGWAEEYEDPEYMADIIPISLKLWGEHPGWKKNYVYVIEEALKILFERKERERQRGL